MTYKSKNKETESNLQGGNSGFNLSGIGGSGATAGKVKKPRIESTGFFMQDLAPLIALNPEQGFDEAIEYMKQLKIKIETSPSKDKAKFTEHRSDVIGLMTSTFINTIIMKIIDSKFSEEDEKKVNSLKEKMNKASIYSEDEFGKYLKLYNYLRRANNPKEEELNDETRDKINKEYNDIENIIGYRSKIESSYDKYFENFAKHLVEKIKNGGSKTSIDNLWERENGEKGFSFNDIERETEAMKTLLKLGVPSEKIVECFTNMASVWELPENKDKWDKESIEAVKGKQKEGFNGFLKIYKDLLGDEFLVDLTTGKWRNLEYLLGKDSLIKRLFLNGSQLFMNKFNECGELVEDKTFFLLIRALADFVKFADPLFSSLKKEQTGTFCVNPKDQIGSVLEWYIKFDRAKNAFLEEHKDIKENASPRGEEKDKRKSELGIDKKDIIDLVKSAFNFKITLSKYSDADSEEVRYTYEHIGEFLNLFGDDIVFDEETTNEIKVSYDNYFLKFADHLMERVRNGRSEINIGNLWERKNGEKGFIFGNIKREFVAMKSLLKLGASSEQIIKNYADLVSVWELAENKDEWDKESIEEVKQKQKRGFNNILKMYKDFLGDKFLADLAADKWKNSKYLLSKDSLTRKLLLEGRIEAFVNDFNDCGELVEDKSFYSVISSLSKFVNNVNDTLTFLKKRTDDTQTGTQVAGALEAYAKFGLVKNAFFKEHKDTKENASPRGEEKDEREPEFGVEKKDIINSVKLGFIFKIDTMICLVQFSDAEREEVKYMCEHIGGFLNCFGEDFADDIPNEFLITIDDYSKVYNCFSIASNPKEEDFNDEMRDKINEAYDFAIENNVGTTKIESLYGSYFLMFAKHLIEKIAKGDSKRMIDNLWESAMGNTPSFNDMGREKDAISSLLKSGVSSEEIVECFTNITSVWGLPEKKDDRDKESIEIVKGKQKEGLNGILKIYKRILEETFLSYFTTDKWRNPKYSLYKDPLIKRFFTCGDSLPLLMEDFEKCGELVEDKIFSKLVKSACEFVEEESRWLNAIREVFKQHPLLKGNKKQPKEKIKNFSKDLELQIQCCLPSVVRSCTEIKEEIREFVNRDSAGVEKRTPPEDKEKEEMTMFLYNNRKQICNYIDSVIYDRLSSLFEFYGLRP